MTVESNLRLAKYFEERLKKARNDVDRERFRLIVLKYQDLARAEAAAAKADPKQKE